MREKREEEGLGFAGKGEGAGEDGRRDDGGRHERRVVGRVAALVNRQVSSGSAAAKRAHSPKVPRQSRQGA